MTPRWPVILAAFLLLAEGPVWAQKPASGDSAKQANDKSADDKVYKDKEFNFEWAIPESLRGKFWYLEVPERKGLARIVRMHHAITGKSDRVILSLFAQEVKSAKRDTKELFESFKLDIENSFSEIVKNEVNDKDRFKGLPAISAKFNGRSKNQRNEIWDRHLFVTKKGGTYFVMRIEADSGMMEKYKSEIDEVIKSLKLK
jgi:hypothetical protein